MKILLIFFTFYLISDAVRCFSVTGYSGGSVLVDSGKLWFSANVKYMAKLPEWRTIINDKKHDKWINDGKFTLFRNKKGNLMIFIRDLNEHDAGGYWIGVLYEWGLDMTLYVEDDLYCKVSKGEMVNIGETANFSCEYSQNHINDVKIILKEGKDSIEMIYSRWKKKERFSISDDKQKNVFHVRITAVTPDDGGVYLCGVWINRHSYNYSIINTVHLHINMPPVVRHEGESAEIICPYDSIYKSNTKSLCKGKCSTRDRNPLSETVREEKETKTDRLTLKDNVTASVFTGTITGLTAEDAGKYWCAVTLETDLNYLYTHLMVIMNEELNLTKYEGDDVSIQCKHHDEDQKSFCKAHEASMCVKDGVSLETIRDDRFSFSDEASTGVFTVNITDLREEDSGIYWCGAHVITSVNLNVKTDFTLMNMICASSALMLIGGFSLIMCKLKKPRFLLCYIK
ncbi:polymeric immunoglobulin receptor-like [Onychostoma macrolepis]|uniref:polymeric immunoglobulin receptor-like n=1 Tax=Onychostoma macrolepis TaxID=369639 RepID=UPI00272C9753|nr:polymeric immunoglobulin receptor-like [Onychostoma macrolepis]